MKLKTLQPEPTPRDVPSLGASTTPFNLNPLTVLVTNRLIALIPPASKALLIGEENPLLEQALQEKKIEIIRSIQPNLPLCMAVNVLADTEARYHRWALSELAHLLPIGGKLLISTAVDIHSDDALPRLIQLLETEFKSIRWDFVRLGWALRLLTPFKAPRRFIRASQDPIYREKQLTERRSLAKKWFYLNSTPPARYFWTPIALFFKPLIPLLEWVGAHLLEPLATELSSDRAISHALFLMEKKPLKEKETEPPLPERQPFQKVIKWE